VIGQRHDPPAFQLGKNPGYYCVGGGGHLFPLPELEPRTIQLVARHYIEYTIPDRKLTVTKQFDVSISVEVPRFDNETVDKAH